MGRQLCDAIEFNPGESSDTLSHFLELMIRLAFPTVSSPVIEKYFTISLLIIIIIIFSVSLIHGYLCAVVS